MGKYPIGPTSCLENSSCHVLIESLTNWVPILVFSFWGYATIVISIFLLYRQVQTLKRSLMPVIHKEGPFVSSPVHSENSAEELSAKEDVRLDVNVRDLHITGYENTAFGEFCYVLCCVISIHWLALFILIFFDSYNQCEVGGIDNLCFYGNHVIFGSYDFNAKIFFVIWWLAAIWFIGWVIYRNRVRNWFRLPCTLSQAHVVNIWAQDQREVLSVNVSLVIKLVRIIQNKFISPENRGHFETLVVTRTAQGRHFFVFRGGRYLIKGNSILKASIQAGNSFSDFHQCEGGLTQEEAKRRFDIIGKNEIPFQPETLMQTTCGEMFSLFHVYQLVMYLSWFWNSYLFIAALMAVVVCLSAAITIYTKHRSQLAIAKLTRYVTQVNVFRDQTWCSVDSRDIVPGDVVKVADDWLLPCDLVIIRGSCICDESALTGEATPVQKYYAPNTAGIYQAEGHGTRHTLFSGTKVLQAGSRQNHNVLAVVTATGMATSKGKLLAAILYPEQMLFKYDEELPVVFILLLLYAIVCFIISLLFMNMTGAQTIWVTKWTYCVAIVNQIMSPLLPVALEVGQLQAVERLKRCGIFSLNPSRIAIAGKIRVFCFDKTGTLTKEGLDFIGVQGLTRNGSEISFGSVRAFDKGDHVDDLTRRGLATCHAVSKYGSRYVGNEVEVKMFQAVGWELIEGFNEPDVVYDGKSEKLKVVKRHEFDHTRATMSVVVQDSQGSFSVYCKGSFEKLQQLCFQESLPEDYLRVAQKHALDGCYVLSLGYKSLGDGLPPEEILEMPRDVLEMKLQFVSLILFRNEPKTDSHVAIKSVKEGEILSTVDLLREGRGALHTSFACYKFLIMYGLMFSIFKLCCYWYGVIVCQMGYLFIDGVAVLTLGYAMTVSHPADILGKARPTSSLLGSLNVSSVFGVWFINIMFLIGAITFMASQPDYVQWPAKYSHGANWWTLGDNWESTVLFFTMYFQFITSAFVFTFGSSFRKSVFHNWIIMVFYGSLMVLMSLLLLLPASGFTSLWHVASEQFNSVNSSSPVWTMYQEAGGSPSPGMSFDFRLRLWLLIMGGLATIIMWQKVFAEGVVAKFVATRFPSVRPKFHV